MEEQSINFKYIISRIRSQKHPVRFLLSRILWHSGLCRLFIINLSPKIKIHFFPTSTSTALWTDPYCFDDDGVNFVRDYLSRGDTFIDIGANIGQLTLTGAEKVGENGKIISIEPHPKIFSFLVRNIGLNKFKNVKAYNVAIGDNEDESFFSDIRSDDQNFITQNGPIKVSVKRLDSLFLIDKIELLKIDTEGYELFVLEGASGILPKTEAIYIEIYQANFERYGYQIKDLVVFLLNHNFRVFKFLSKDNLKEINSNYASEICENLIAVKEVDSLQKRLKNLTIIQS